MKIPAIKASDKISGAAYLEYLEIYKEHDARRKRKILHLQQRIEVLQWLTDRLSDLAEQNLSNEQFMERLKARNLSQRRSMEYYTILFISCNRKIEKLERERELLNIDLETLYKKMNEAGRPSGSPDYNLLNESPSGRGTRKIQPTDIVSGSLYLRFKKDYEAYDRRRQHVICQLTQHATSLESEPYARIRQFNRFTEEELVILDSILLSIKHQREHILYNSNVLSERLARIKRLKEDNGLLRWHLLNDFAPVPGKP